MKLDLDTLTMDEVGKKIDKTISKLHKHQHLYAIMQEEDLRRIEQLIREFHKAQKGGKVITPAWPSPKRRTHPWIRDDRRRLVKLVFWLAARDHVALGLRKLADLVEVKEQR